MSATTRAKQLVMMAARNLSSHRVKSAIIASIMVVGTALLVIGTAMIDSLEASMQRVVTSSLAGHLQVYSSEGRDKLALFGDLSTGLPDLGEIEDFGRVKSILMADERVEDVLPMGIRVAIGTGGNDADRVIQALREAYERGDEQAKLAGQAQLRQLARVLRDELELQRQISADESRQAQDAALLDRVLSPQLWQDMEHDPEPTLMMLESKLAPLVPDARPFFVRYLGTDPQRFAARFDRLEIVSGQMIPPNQRGLLLSKRVHEQFIKHVIARELDMIRRAMQERGERIAQVEELRSRVKRMSNQYKRVLYQLDERESAQLEAKLRAHLGLDAAAAPNMPELMRAFLLVDDDSFERRYAFFYQEIAPLIELYRVNVGDVVVLRGFSKRGSMESVNLKIWGTFQFKGIEDSDLAGAVNLTDLLTFRRLYGKMTREQLQELERARAQAGAQDVRREDVVDSLFGEDAELTQDVALQEQGFDEFEGVSFASRKAREAQTAQASYDPAELEQGLALNAAIILRDPSQLRQTRADLERALRAQGLKLRVVDWQEAAGVVGQLIIVIRVVLYIAIFIIFSVALVIINNSMVLATMERVAEVGTMRAIGAQRAFILLLFMLETMVLGAAAGLAGALLGVGVVELLSAIGIPATNDVMRFLYAGPRLRPDWSASNVLFGLGVILIVSVASTLYPALVATRIQPVVAMRGRE